ncbi:MAG: TolB family protein [Actinomycetota bacterium]
MASLDDRLREELQRSLRPADPIELYEDLSTRHGRRRVARKIGAAALVVVVLGLAAGGFLYFNDIFRGEPADQMPAPTEPRVVIGRSDLQIFEKGGSNSSRFEIWSVATDGSDPRPLYAEDIDAVDPVASPDGTSVAFLRRDPEEPAPWADQQLMLLGLTDGTMRVLAEGIATMPQTGTVSWAPDGSEIALLDTRRKGLDAFDEFGLPLADIRVIDVATGGSRWIDIGGLGQGLAWSPDGGLFALVRTAGESSELVLVDLDGLVVSTLDVGELAAPAWSPSGDAIAYLATEAGDSDVRTVSAGSGTIADHTSDGGLKESVAWSQSGEALVYTHATPSGCEALLLQVRSGDVVRLTDRHSLGGCPRSVSWQRGVDAPSNPPTTAADSTGQDVGLPFRLCDVSTLGGVHLTNVGRPARVWVGTRVTDLGSCPDLASSHVVAADTDLDGVADVWTEMTCRGGCQPLPRAAMDLTADGTDELFVLEDLFSIADYQVFTVVGGELVAATMAPPGHPEAGLIPDEVAVLSVGGDEGFGGYLRCEGDPAAPTLVVIWSEHPVEGPGSDVKQVHETRLVMDADGTFSVTGVSDTTLPAGQAPPGMTGASTEASCGIELAL